MEIKRMHSTRRWSGIVEYNGIINFSGFTSLEAGFGAQLRDIFAQFEGRLADAGSDKSRVLSALIMLKDMSYFDELNLIWEDWFDGCNLPARATFKADLCHPSMLVEIVFTAAAK